MYTMTETGLTPADPDNVTMPRRTNGVSPRGPPGGPTEDDAPFEFSPEDMMLFAAKTDEKSTSRRLLHPMARSVDANPSLRGETEFSTMPSSRQPYIPSIPEPPQVSAVGRAQGLVSKLDPRSWLEVADPRHRYAKNLRSYYQAWDLLGSPGGEFLAWLDGDSNYELERCPRHVLNSDTVHYCASPEETQSYALRLDNYTFSTTTLTTEEVGSASKGLVGAHGFTPVGVASSSSSDTSIEGSDGTGARRGIMLVRHADSGVLLETGEAGWIFVLREGVLYANAKRTHAPRFHHSSFFAGGSVEVAGMLVVRSGQLKRLYPHSGHYRPGDRHISYLLRFLEKEHVDLTSIEVDGQHTMKVGRYLVRDGNSGAGVSCAGGGGFSARGAGEASLLRKVKKVDNPYWLRGDAMLGFLALKGRSTPLFEELLRSRQRVSSWSPLEATAAGDNSLDAASGSSFGGGFMPSHEKERGARVAPGGGLQLGRVAGRRVTLGTEFASEECAAMEHGAMAVVGGFESERRCMKGLSVSADDHDELASVDLLELEERMNNEEEDSEGVAEVACSQSPPVGLRLMQGLDLATAHDL